MSKTRPRYGWPVLFKEFLIKSFESNLDEILSNKEEFIKLCQEKFPGNKLTSKLLNAYICLYRKGRLKVVEDRKQRTNFNKQPFHREDFLKLFEKENIQ